MSDFRTLPAIDLRGGAAVQLVGGAFDAERVRRPDPIAVAREMIAAGLCDLHVVDLDAAAGTGSNSSFIGSLARLGATLQVGGGLRDEAAVRRVLALGAARAIVGTRAVEDPEWLEHLAVAHPERIVLALDVRGREVQSHAWTRGASRSIEELLSRNHRLPLAAILLTAVHREGRLQGPDLDLVAEAVRVSAAPVLASGGVASIEDLEQLRAAGAGGAIIGMALYTGRLSLPALARFARKAA
jgi:phosphoribosylformimino-5-aminoimidazole carboxamide ribotide isomerase